MHEEKTYNVEYSSNNSGGSWWLTPEDWKALEDNGWTVEWLGKAFCGKDRYSWEGRVKPAPQTCAKNKCHGHRQADSYEEAMLANPENWWLGSIAREATIEVKAYSDTLAEGVASMWWEEATGKNASEQGCNCCGQPHNFWAHEVKTDG